MPSKTAPGLPDGLAYTDYAARSRATQQHILDAAVEALVEAGYAGASTLEIQRRAGVSRGRLLHQYPHRDALLVAAVQHIAAARVSATAERRRWPKDAGRRIDAAVAAMWGTYHEGYFWAATELWLAARYNEALREALKPGEQALGASIRAAVDEMFGPELAQHEDYVATRELLNTSMRGVALTYAFDPHDPDRDTHLPMWRGMARRALL
ncbi:TetR family transcriptional regulator [Branchiibius hedensis]|uniref:DNA-binding transcriptional regulator, AcrR family n=1 Tax=Branchiibius hedensis TaxID=672460 RepID=A0A2Y8ZMW1_9MICO|nr:TetR family transcriptional regulator [Branchiibius hedensis]PWJ23948.1 TetR family transcriptional regulator [Branchiibius hedensis]SSA32766.1 DNA-binding transcriptional regulator, AcrR family [Branchiibius hedensis]